MFKKDEYIVTLIVNISTNCAKNNYCFKQQVSKHYMSPCIDLTGNKNNDNISLKFDKSQHLQDWRYATTEEAEHYELINKPYDVTTLPEFILPDNWYIIITEENLKDAWSWRMDEPFETYDNPGKHNFKINGITGICGSNEKGHNSTLNIKGSTYDFGNEITYTQFKKYVLNKHVDKEDLSYLIPFLHNLNIT